MATVTRDADAAALMPQGCGVGAHPARGGPAGARSAVPHPDPGWPSVEHPRAPLALLAASRFHATLRRNRVWGSRRGALPRRGAGCTCWSSPRSPWPPPGATPRHAASTWGRLRV